MITDIAVLAGVYHKIFLILSKKNDKGVDI